MEQLTIFDVFQIDTEEHDIQTLPEDDMIRIISERTGLVFKTVPNLTEETQYKWYEAKQKKILVDVHYSHYFDGNKRFIGVGINCGNEGCGCPCDSLDEAINKIRRNIKRFTDGTD